MKFTMTHTFEVDRPTFEKYLNDPELIEMARAIPALKTRALVDYRENGKLRTWRFRVDAATEIPERARAVVKPEMLAWIEESTWDPDRHLFTWQIHPTHFADRLECRGTWALFEEGPRTRRVIEGDLRVKVLLVGRIVEEFVVARVKEQFEAEAEVQKRFYAGKIARG